MILMANDGVLELLFNQVLKVNGEVLEVTYVLVITEKVLSCEVPWRTEGLLVIIMVIKMFEVINLSLRKFFQWLIVSGDLLGCSTDH